MEANIKLLSENLFRQEEIIRLMLDLSREQLQALKNPSQAMKSIESIISQRGQMVEELYQVRKNGRKIEQNLANKFSLREFVLSKLARYIERSDYELLQVSYERVTDALSEVVALDEETAQLMQARLSEVMVARRSVNQAQAFGAYRHTSRMKKD